jgi:hypothetical protein
MPAELRDTKRLRDLLRAGITLALIAAFGRALAPAETIWIEGEKPVRSTMNRHPWYDSVKRDQLSGGDFISNFNNDKPAEAEYVAEAEQGGRYEFWVRANPVQASLSYRLNGGEWTPIDLDKNQSGSTNIAADGKPDLRFIAWARVGPVELVKGRNTVSFRMDSKNNHHGALDCFVLANEPFQPRGILKPDELAQYAKQIAQQNKGWFAFDPKPDAFRAESGFDLRALNEKAAGEHGFISVKGSQFILGDTGRPVRFWGVNGPPGDLKDPESLHALGRLLAKYGVNLVRVHGGYFDASGEVDPAKVQHAIDVVEAMKQAGIYSHFSIYFPLWLTPKPGTSWLAGYDGNKHPFAALYFNKDFQRKYVEWWKALLLTPGRKSGKRLVDEPAVAGLEMINEDSYFFWTFSADNIPDPQLRILEKQFGEWLVDRYGSLDAALAKWNGQKTPRDNPGEGRMGFRPIWNMFNERSDRDKDTARFLFESQRGFYQKTYDFLRRIGFRGVMTASNWITASPQYFGPLEKLSYMTGDFVDRHGYFSCNHQGDQAAWSVRDGHTYSDRSALRFEAEEPGKPKQFVHPAMDPSYNNKPSMISETTFTRPNRYRSEAPLFYAAYGALQDSDAIVHFALDSSTWAVKPGFFMQPWTLLSPAMMGQFPAAALVFRKGLVEPGAVLADLTLKEEDLLNLIGTPLPQDAAMDELRLKDVPQGTKLKPGGIIDPLVHFAGRANVNFTPHGHGASSRLVNLKPYVNRAAKTVTSTNRQLLLDYGKGVLRIDAPAAQGVSGDLKAAGSADLKDIVITSAMPLGHIIVVSLDDEPLASSRRMLLQVMSEEKATNFQTEPAGAGARRITNIGQDPWLVKELSGTMKFKRADAGELKVTALDFSGYPAKQLGSAAEIELQSATLYYLISRE